MKRVVMVLVSLLITENVMSATAPSQDHWVGSWATAPTAMAIKDGVANLSFRSVAHLSLGGTVLRLTLTNQFGRTPLLIPSTHVALSSGAGKVNQRTDLAVTFNHQSSVTVPAGSFVLSDPVPMTVAPFADVAISIYVPQQVVSEPTCHEYGLSTTYITPGDTTAQAELTNAKTMHSTCFLASVLVDPKETNAASVVTFGDSITDGARSTVDANNRYPDELALRLHANRQTANLGVLNEGISGGRVLYEGHGPSALERYDRDVLAQPGVRYVIYLEGINDIGQILRPTSPEKDLTVDELIFAATQLVERGHLHGVKVIGATLLPFGAKNVPTSPEWLKIRQVIRQYNDWVRNGHVFDGVADFNKATADPESPDTLLPAYDSGDHVHPSDAGYKAMADSVDLRYLSR